MLGRTSILAGCALLLAVGGGSIAAQAAGEDDSATMLASVSAPITSGCPALRWHLVRVGGGRPGQPGEYKGVVYFADMSGASILDGTLAGNGTFRATVTSVAGTGPSGTLTGRRSQAGVQAHLAGPGCSNVAVNMNNPNFQAPLGTGH
ncbi:MAG: hypothetical protein JO122_20485 [Acetobacteraceae bacterium]|nr:hypothetical protein [Acetobacteraceae bacterium]